MIWPYLLLMVRGVVWGWEKWDLTMGYEFVGFLVDLQGIVGLFQ